MLSDTHRGVDLAEWASRLREAVASASGTEVLGARLGALTRELLRDASLRDRGVPRAGRHADRTWWLYYDGELNVIRSVLAKGARIPAHNHGAWNVTGVVEGALRYVTYHRADAGDVPGRAELHVAEDAVLCDGELLFCPPPPDDIHEVECLQDETMTILVAPQFAEVREYYAPAEGTYVLRGGAE